MWSDLIRSSKIRVQGCRGQEGRRDAWSEGEVEERQRGREGKRERERERERKRERRGAAQWPVVSVGLYGPVGAAARAVAGVCSTHWSTDTDTHAQSTDACRCSVAMVKLEIVHFIGKGISRDSA